MRKKGTMIVLVLLLVFQNLLFGMVGFANEEDSTEIPEQDESIIEQPEHPEEDESDTGLEDDESVIDPEDGDSTVTDEVDGSDQLPVTNDVYGSVQFTEVKLYYLDEDGKTEIEYINDQAQKRLSLGENVRLEFSWILPENHEVSAGDYFTFNLPYEFKMHMEAYGTLGEVGTFWVTKEGLVTMEFNENVNYGTPVSDGKLSFWSNISEDITDNPDRDIIFEEINQRITIGIKPNGGHLIEKWIDKSKVGNNAKTLEWTIDINTSLNSIQNARVEDNIPDGLELDTSSIEIYNLDVNLNGNKTRGSVVSFDTSKSDENNLIIDFGNINSAYRVIFKTNVVNDEDGNITFHNTARLFENDKEITSDSDNITVERGAFLKKEAGQYDPFAQTVKWEIRYNYGERIISQAKAVLTDTFSGTDQDIVGGLHKDSFKVYRVTLNGGVEVEEELIDYFTVATNPDGPGFVLSFNEEISSAYKIQYTTKAKNPIYESGTMKNTVVSGEDRQEASKPIGQVIIDKKVTKVDFASKTAEWEIVINGNNFEMTNVVIEDDFPNGGLELSNPIDLKIINDDTESVLNEGEGKDYLLKDNGADGFTISFLKPISTSHTITYTTNFDYYALSKHESYKDKFVNRASIDWSGVQEPPSPVVVIEDFEPDTYTKYNGFKQGSYDATKREITWEIGMNYNLLQLQNAHVIDYLEKDQELVKGSIKVYPLKLTGGQNGYKVDYDNELTLNDDYKVEEISDGTNPGIQITLIGDHLNTKSGYFITFKTHLDEKTIEKYYRNKATLVNGEDKYSLVGNVEIPNGDEYVSKTGKQNGPVIDWKVWINRGQSSLVKGMKIIDTPSTNQILLEDSFVIYKTTVSSNGTVTKAPEPDNTLTEGEDYTLKFKENSEGMPIFEIEFKIPIDSPYLLEYQSFINASQGQTVINEVEFIGHEGTDSKTDDKFPIIVSFSGADGGGSIKRGNIEVVKVDAEDHSIVLEGAEFRLYYNDSKRTFIRSATTDKKGIARFENLILRSYIVEEVTPPNGYLLSQDFEETVILGLGHENEPLKIQFENFRVDSPNVLGRIGDYVWLDTNRNGRQDEGEEGVKDVVVKLYKVDDENFEMITTTDENGKYLFDKLSEGKYKVCFYLPEEYGFTEFQTKGVDEKENSDARPLEDDPTIGCSDIINLPRGGVDLTIDAGLLLGRIGDYVWVDSNRNGIQDELEDSGFNGVKVELYKKNEDTDEFEKIDETETADKDGKLGYYLFDNLLPGKYKVKFELPSGYSFTSKGRGNDHEKNSKVDSHGWTEEFSLDPGKENLTIDAGLVRRPSGGSDDDDWDNGGSNPPPTTPPGKENPKDKDPKEKDPKDPNKGTPGDHTGGDEGGLPANPPAPGSDSGDTGESGGTDGDNGEKTNNPPVQGETAPKDKGRTLPQTGENPSLLPLLGLFFCVAGAILWYRRKPQLN